MRKRERKRWRVGVRERRSQIEGANKEDTVLSPDKVLSRQVLFQENSKYLMESFGDSVLARDKYGSSTEWTHPAVPNPTRPADPQTPQHREFN